MLADENTDNTTEGFALREGNANIMKLAQEMMSTLDKKGGKEGVDMEGAEGIEQMLEGLGGVKGIMKALGNMKT